jgi:glycolate oxidase FAD binding subunit
VQFIDGSGNILRGGGKVVKNAAGFDFPKLLTGSMGRLGLMTELTFKVFPKPEASITAIFEKGSLADAAKVVRDLAIKSFDLDALELIPPARIAIRISGIASGLPARLETIAKAARQTAQPLAEKDAASFWHSLLHWEWAPSDCWRAKVPIASRLMEKIDTELSALKIERCYSVGGNAALLAWPSSLGDERLEKLLSPLGLTAMVLDGASERPLVGAKLESAVQRRVQHALDPHQKWGALA